MDDRRPFNENFRVLTGHSPFRWQERLFHDFCNDGLPPALDLPTGLGKTSVMAVWLIARACGVKLPRRLVYVVDRRAVVDQASAEAEKLRKALEGNAAHFVELDESARVQAKQAAAELKKQLGFGEKNELPISTLRGAHVDNREWLDDPTVPTIIVGTVDMIGSRLLFSGYGVSRKMRPFHAGLLGADALVVLDEAHLVPPFAHLLRTIEQDTSLQPNDGGDRALVPPFGFLPLSATQREPGGSGGARLPFRLEDEDWKTDAVARRRLEAKKRLRLEPLVEKDTDRQIAEAAWASAMKDGAFFRITVFCNRRDKKEDGGGPSAQGVKEEIEKLARGDRTAGRAETKIHPVELLVGSRRVHERDKVEQSLRELGFMGKKDDLKMPAFLVATSAGEVGVDIDADHMICDLVAWERMVQRLGRVNRRGEGDAEIRVFWKEPSVKDVKAPNEHEKRALTAFASKSVIERLNQIDGAFDASPGALRELAENARGDTALKKLIDKATTPEPLRPALNRALVDAWSMTSLEEHTGRPDVQPWLCGWDEDEKPQSNIVWREHLPAQVAKKEVNEFFDAAPPHLSETLETETWRAADWLFKRVAAVTRKRNSGDEPDELREDGIVAFMLDAKGELEQDDSRGAQWSVRDLAALNKKESQKNKEAFIKSLSGRTLVVDARLGGLREGMFADDEDGKPSTMDTAEWDARPFRVRSTENPARTDDPGWKESYRLAIEKNDDGDAVRWLAVDERKEQAESEESRAISTYEQKLEAHQEATKKITLRFADALGLPPGHAEMLAVAALLHDEGKACWRWQRAFNAPRGAVYAKTKGPVNLKLLDGYRHEFGSLFKVRQRQESEEVTPFSDTLLHLLAAHHGSTRPLISVKNCEGVATELEACASEATLRFAHLQKRWGPWGLAWWESLLRAADQQASRDNDNCSSAEAADTAPEEAA
jgi:CRISPR-associated endonuclease/helicase Cas3